MVALCLGPAAYAQGIPERFKASISDFGNAGLIQMPTGRQMEAGEFVVSAGDIFPYRRYSISIQVLPWLSGTYRYTRTENRSFNAQFPDEPQTDKGLDIGVRLLQETDILPEVSIGLRDIGGTQLFSSEYIAASKHWGPLDFTLGLAWGNAGNRGHIDNPLGFFADSLKTRTGTGGTGTINSSFFTGETAAFFGGIEYITPINGLRLKVEYDGNNYQSEPLGNSFDTSTPFNFGAEYSPAEWITFRGSLQRGNEAYFGATVKTNFNTFQGQPKTDEPPRPIKQRHQNAALAALAVQPNALAVQRALKDNPPQAPLPSSSTSGARTASETEPLFAALLELGMDVQDIWIEGDYAVVEFDPVALPIHEELASAAWMVARHPGFLGVSEVVLIPVGPEYAVGSFKVAEMERSLALTGSLGAMTSELSVEWWQAVVDAGAPKVAAADTATLYSLLEQMQLPTDELRIEEETLIVSFDGASTLDSETRATISTVLEDSLYAVGLQRVEVRDSALKPSTQEILHHLVMSGDASNTPAQDRAERIAPDLFRELEENNITPIRFALDDRTAILSYSQSRYRNGVKAMGRAARILTRHVTDDIEFLRLVPKSNSLRVADVTLKRSVLENSVNSKSAEVELLLSAQIASPGPMPATEVAEVHNPNHYPVFDWSLRPKTRQSLGGGDEFLAGQLYALASATFRPFDGVRITGRVGQDLWNNFDNLIDKREADATLARVRSNIVNYLQGGSTWIDRLSASYVQELAPDLYGRATAGIYELMYAGYGGEVLYRPTGQRWAVGLDWNWVHQRDFDGMFGLQDFTQTTGHASFYYDIPWQNISAQLMAGRYLAGDIGATLSMGKEFDNGTRMGFWATKTDISPSEFGEGSFDKGFFLSFPLELFTSRPTKGNFAFSMAPLTRDGGQRVNVPDRLYGIVGNRYDRAPASGFDEILD